MFLVINKPYIKDNKLISQIEYNSKKYNMYFEVDNEYVKYLCHENCDSFLVSLLPFIVKHNYDVKINGRISSKLYYQLTNYLLPLLCSEFNKKKINIDCELSNINFNSSGVGASVSLGVDSFYTLIKHKNQKDSKFNITHLTFFNAGSHGDFGGDKARKLYHNRLNYIRKFCNENNYKLVSVDTNMNELIMMNHKKTHSFRTIGCVLALQKLFGKYYFASGYHYNEMRIDEGSCGHYDTLNVQNLSTESLVFYSSGLEVTRMEKVKYISNFKETYSWLNVCVTSDKNCGKCNKCIRTEAELDSIDMLNKYDAVFNVVEFEKNKNKILSQIISESRGNDSDAMYNKEIINNYKINGKDISIKVLLLSFLPNLKKIKMIIKRIVPKEKLHALLKKYRKNNINDGWTD